MKNQIVKQRRLVRISTYLTQECSLLILFSLFLFFSCDEKRKDNNNVNILKADIGEDTRSMTYIENEDTLNIYIKEALQNGDKDAYFKISRHFRLNGKRNELFLYALLFANKYNYSEAYADLHTCIEIGLKPYYDKKTKKLSEYYMLKAYELDSTLYNLREPQETLFLKTSNCIMSA